MTKLTFTNHAQSTTTVLENEFIDQHMAKANGEYVKVYLLLLRHLHAPSGTLTISEIADKLECTEKDVTRALNYWKKQGLLDFATGNAKSTASDTSTVSNASAVKKHRNDKAFKQLIFVTEQYLGKPLSPTESESMIYFYDDLQMSAELIEYLIEYCVENGHKSMHYIQSVALNWHKQNIKTVAEAKANALNYNKNYYCVLNAFGIKGRSPAASEITYMKRWFEEYGFSIDIVMEACNRTMNAIHQPNFDYTESILKNWLSNGAKTLKNISALDANYQLEKERKKKQPVKPKSAASSKFNNFESRSYDMNDLERRLVQQ